MFNKSKGLLGALGFSGVSHMLRANMRSNHESSDLSVSFNPSLMPPYCCEPVLFALSLILSFAHTSSLSLPGLAAAHRDRGQGMSSVTPPGPLVVMNRLAG